jgi:hypothetical protein
MNNLLLSEELIKQIKLIKYDRSKTVFEQKEIETSTQITDRLGNRGEYSASPEIFKDPSYIEYEKLSDKEKEKLQDEFLNKKWKSIERKGSTERVIESKLMKFDEFNK